MQAAVGTRLTCVRTVVRRYVRRYEVRFLSRTRGRTCVHTKRSSQEVVIAERFLGCHGVVQLRDAFFCAMPKPAWCLVYDLHESSLKTLLEHTDRVADPLGCSDAFGSCRCILVGLLSIHKVGFTNADIKPDNILVQARGHGPPSCGHGPRWTAVIADLGCAVEAPSDAREKVQAGGALKMQTLWWRAPEILFGDEKFDFSVDVWSLGLVFCELAGSRFHMGHASKAQYLKALCGQLGSPDGTAVAKLSGYPASGVPSTGRKAWPARTFTMVGSSGYELLDKML